MNVYTGLEYLKIDIANNFGLDKVSFEERIDWFNREIRPYVAKDSSDDYLWDIIPEIMPDEPELFYAGLLAYRDTLAGKPTGYRISLDAVCSGVQCLATLTLDEPALKDTGLIGSERGDIYSAIYRDIVNTMGINATEAQIKSMRTSAKKAIVPMIYGSKRAPEREFPDEVERSAFLQAADKRMEGCLTLRNILMNCVDEKATEYVWVMPDGHTVVTPVTKRNWYETTLSDGFTFKWSIYEKGTTKWYIKNAANVTHACDSLIMREMVRRCSYEPRKVFDTYNLLLGVTKVEGGISTAFEKAMIILDKSEFVPTNIIEAINTTEEVNALPEWAKEKLIGRLYLMLKYKPFDMVVIHDCFTMSANNGNYVRYWFKEIMAEIAESNMLYFLCGQLPNNPITPESLNKEDKIRVAQLIRESEYGLS